jgi:hypothetical protein
MSINFELAAFNQTTNLNPTSTLIGTIAGLAQSPVPAI